MTASEYRNNGFDVSANIEQAKLDRAERMVMQAYILPILPDACVQDSEVKDAVMTLTSLYISLQSIFATRSGAKEKTTPQSYTAQREEILKQYAGTCDLLLQQLRKANGAIADAKVDDICGIYFVTNYFYN